MEDTSVQQSVKDYYGKELSCTADLKTQACISTGTGMSRTVREALADVHDEVTNRYYGCGLIIPEKLDGMKILDLGSGSGRDCFAVSKLVGPEGHVTGIDMTDEQLEVARKYIPYHTEKFGYSKPNVDYVKGYIEKLSDAGIEAKSMNIIISNCVVNLSPDKKAVLSEAYKALKVGGELYFSDVYCDVTLSEEVRKHKVLWGECIAGALCWKDLYSLAKEIGFSTPRLYTASPVPIDRDEFKQVLGEAKFVSACYRLFKLPEKRESVCQVIYNGELAEHEKELKLDHQTTFKTGDVVQADSELATILSCSRFSDEFDFRPVSKKPKEDSSSCCPPKSTVQEVDPFVYLEEKNKKGEKVAAACCGPKTKCC